MDVVEVNLTCIETNQTSKIVDLKDVQWITRLVLSTEGEFRQTTDDGSDVS